jgi:hypothetical protein
MAQARRPRMHAHPMTGRRSRVPRLIVALLLGELLAVVPVATFAAPPASHQELTVALQVSTTDCNRVVADVGIDWRAIRGGADANIASVELHALSASGSIILTSIVLEPGKNTDKQKGHIDAQLVRESGYFDHQTYPGYAYRVAVVTASGSWVTSEPVAMPSCVPLAPTTGSAAGGTAVTVYGGGTFGGSVFTMSTSVILGGTTIVSPTSVATDGSSMTFMTPAGGPSTCVSVQTEPGLPFPLPDFCYGA